LNLTDQLEHIREQASLQQGVRLNVFCCGMGFSLGQYVTQSSEHLFENRDGSGVQGNSHGRSWIEGGVIIVMEATRKRLVFYITKPLG
jgi:hypothetical protein